MSAAPLDLEISAFWMKAFISDLYNSSISYRSYSTADPHGLELDTWSMLQPTLMSLQLYIYLFTHVTVAWWRSQFHGLAIRILFRLEPQISFIQNWFYSAHFHCLYNLLHNHGRKLNWCGKNGYSKSQMWLLLYPSWHSAKLLTDCMKNCSHRVLLLSSGL